MSTTLRLLLIAAICIFNVNAEIKTTDATGEGDGSGGGDGVVGYTTTVMTTKSSADVGIAETKMKVADITGIKAKAVMTIGAGADAEEMTVKSVTADKRQRRADPVSGTIEFTTGFTKAHAKGAAIEWTVTTKDAPKSSAVTTTVGVGIFAMVAALF